MKTKEIYKKKLQAQLDEWSAQVDKIKARASDLNADAQLKIKDNVAMLKAKINEGKNKLSKLDDASEENWESVKRNVESTWDSLKKSIDDFVTKFK